MGNRLIFMYKKLKRANALLGGRTSLSLANPPCAPDTVKIIIFPLGVTTVVQGTARQRRLLTA